MADPRRKRGLARFLPSAPAGLQVPPDPFTQEPPQGPDAVGRAQEGLLSLIPQQVLGARLPQGLEVGPSFLRPRASRPNATVGEILTAALPGSGPEALLMAAGPLARPAARLNPIQGLLKNDQILDVLLRRLRPRRSASAVRGTPTEAIRQSGRRSAADIRGRPIEEVVTPSGKVPGEPEVSGSIDEILRLLSKQGDR